RSRLTSEKRQQVGVDLVLVGRRKAVRRARVINLLGALDKPGRFLRRVLDGDDLVVLAVQDQGRHVELFQVLGLVRFGKRLAAFVGVREAGLHARQPARTHCPSRFGPAPYPGGSGADEPVSGGRFSVDRPIKYPMKSASVRRPMITGKPKVKTAPRS